MKSDPSFLMISVLIPFFFAANVCHVLSSRRDADETAQQTEKQLLRSPMIDLGNQKHFEGDIMLPGKTPIGGIKPSAVYENRIWPTKKIPYVISNSYTKDQVNLISDAMQAYKSKTCIEFVPRTTENDYIDIKKTGDGCYSYVGRYGGSQPVSLDDGCLYPKTIRHELMHAAGFYHEQSRTDRDDYVKINYDNIQPKMQHNFEKYDSKAVQLLGTPYDLKSIMHYAWHYFAKDLSKPTLTDKNGNKVGPSDDFTLTDLLDLNRLYKCQNGSYYVEWKVQALKNAVFVWGSDCDIVGNLIRKVTSKKEECGALCAAHLRCTRFTWDSTGFCTLKTGPKVSPEARQLKGAMCGYISEGNSNFQWQNYNFGQEQWSYGCDFPGNDIRTVTREMQTCFSLCKADSKCTSYAERKDPGSSVNKCYLKTGKGPIARAIYTDDGSAYCSMMLSRI